MFALQVPSVEVNGLMKTFKMKPLLFPVCVSIFLEMIKFVSLLNIDAFLLSVCLYKYMFVCITTNCYEKLVLSSEFPEEQVV